MPLADNALTTLDAVKGYLEIDLSDVTPEAILQDGFLAQQINGISADIIDYVRFDIAAEYILPVNATVETPRTLPYNIESVCIELVAITYQRRGSEHLDRKSVV